MGGVPVLMALAAMGIGYGWHPDGNGGVEYVIQIPPDKLDHVRQAGEITSSIPPEVQGRVSRVVVRVGDQPLQRKTPPPADSSRAPDGHRAEVAARDAPAARLSFAQSDHAPVPIPEIRDSSVASSKAPAAAPSASVGSASVLKPAPQTGSGFQFPGQNRQAGGGTAASSSRRTGAMAPPSSGGPSTEPTNTQDDSWYDLDSAERQRNSSDPPSLQRGSDSDRAQNGGSDFRTQPQSSAGSHSQSTAGGRTGPSGDSDSASSYPDRSSTTRSASQDPSSSASPSASSGPSASDSGNRSAPSDMPGNFGRMPDRLQSSSSGSGGGDGRAPSGPSETPPHDGRGADSRFGDTGGAGGRRSGGSDDFRDSSTEAPDRTPVDPRLSEREASALPPGAWSYDAHGRPIDREGYVLNSEGRRASPDRGAYDRDGSGGYRRPQDERAAPNYPESPNFSDSPNYPASPNDPGRYAGGGGRATADRWQDRGPAWPSEADRRYASTAPGQERRRTAPPPAEPPRSSDESSRDETGSEPDSSSTGSGSTGSGSTASGKGDVSDPQDASGSNHSRPAKSVAAQPLFNGLLLISFVANVYLAFWLRNLRHQFRELVAAKRVSASGDPS